MGNMHMIRTLSVGAAALALSGAALAQFDGPAPLAWRWMQNSAILSGSPTVDGNTVYVAAGQRIYALDKDSGNQRWKFPNVEPITGKFKGKPILTNGLVIAAADNKTIYAVDTNTRESKWTYVAPAPIIGDPVLADKHVVVKLSDNSLMAVDAATGQPSWNAPVRLLTGIVGQISAYQNNVLVLTDDYQLLSLSITNPQKPNWKQRFSTLGTDAAPVVFGDMVYVASGPFLASINANSGSARWQSNLNEDIAFQPAVSSGGIMVVTRDRHAYMLDTNTGRRNAKISVDLGSDAQARPTMAGDLVVVPTANGGIQLIDSKTGNTLWNYLIRPVGEMFAETTNRQGTNQGTSNPTRILTIPAAGPAVIDGNTLLVLAYDGSLLAFDKALGVDLTPPSVRQTWPTPGDVVSGQPPLMFVFKIEDESSGIDEKTMKIDVDGTPMDFKFGRDGVASVSISQTGKNKPLTDGRRKVNVTVSDWLGNTATRSFEISIDNTLRPLQPPALPGNTGGGTGGPGGGGPLGGGRGPGGRGGGGAGGL
jgi:outer membrane protein assembly factor BamB